MARSSMGTLLLLIAAVVILACQLDVSNLLFVGSAPVHLRGVNVARGVGVDYLLRNGPKDADPPAVDTSAAAGAVHEAEFKKRPFGIARYAPGVGGKGAVVMEVTPKSRYPGDPQGQAFVAGVQPGWVVKSVNGVDVTGQQMEAIMQMMDDEVLDPVAAMSLNLKSSGVQTNIKQAGQDLKQGSQYAIKSELDDIPVVELPVKIVYQEMR